ncbi:MAG: AMIN domain-containing protein, partial [Alphaproteobacteria bacterium]
MSTPQIARFIALFLLVGTLLVPARAHALGVTGVRFGTHPDNIRLVLDLSTSTDFRVFALNDPYRMVIDLPDFNWQAGNASAAPATGVRALRYGKLQPGVARIVFDMA